MNIQVHHLVDLEDLEHLLAEDLEHPQAVDLVEDLEQLMVMISEVDVVDSVGLVVVEEDVVEEVDDVNSIGDLEVTKGSSWIRYFTGSCGQRWVILMPSDAFLECPF